MKLPSAYSIELKQVITADQADKEYSEGRISSKFAFECPDEICHAAVTCANLDKPKRLRKRDPYYKVVDSHHADCLIGDSISPSRRRSGEYDDIYSDSDEYFSHAVRLNLQPSSIRRSEESYQDQEPTSIEKRGRPSTSEQEGKQKIQRSKVLSAMIDAFLANESLVVQLPDSELINIKELFIEINGQELSALPDDHRIYYGPAWINKLEQGYQVRFANTLKAGTLEKRPTFLITDQLIEHSNLGKFKAAAMDKLTDKKPKQVFIYSVAGPRQKDSYLNFWLDGLEYMDYRTS